MTAAMPIVELKEVSFGYPGGPLILRDLDFTLLPGDRVGIIAPNGSGKTTLFLLIMGLLKPLSGRMQIFGKEVREEEDFAGVRRRIGLLFQDADDQLFSPTVLEDVAFGPLNMGLPAEEVHATVSAALDAVGAAHLARRAPYRLSGGEKRAVAIAGVLAMSPSVLVLDEPSAGLDPVARRRLIALLRSFSHTKVIASHDLDLVLDVCTRVLVMREGSIEADGPPTAIFADVELLRRCHLEPPLSSARPPR